MNTEFKSMAHLQNTFFLFLAPFVARLASKFEKSSNMTHIFLFTVIKKGLKNAEFHADFKSV
jgi:hypothetical protein